MLKYSPHHFFASFFFTGDKRFECSQCKKRFMRSDHLTKHYKTHINTKNLWGFFFYQNTQNFTTGTSQEVCATHTKEITQMKPPKKSPLTDLMYKEILPWGWSNKAINYSLNPFLKDFSAGAKSVWMKLGFNSAAYRCLIPCRQPTEWFRDQHANGESAMVSVSVVSQKSRNVF